MSFFDFKEQVHCKVYLPNNEGQLGWTYSLFQFLHRMIICITYSQYLNIYLGPLSGKLLKLSCKNVLSSSFNLALDCTERGGHCANAENNSQPKFHIFFGNIIFTPLVIFFTPSGTYPFNVRAGVLRW